MNKYKKQYGNVHKLGLKNGGTLAVSKIKNVRIKDKREFVTIQVMRGFEGRFGFIKNKYNHTIDLPLMEQEEVTKLAKLILQSNEEK
jgi:hypothetical protein